MGVSSAGVSDYVNTSSGVAIGVYAANGISGAGVSVVLEFTPADLFTSGSVGFWHDYTDSSTWFQDTAGTTPATALGDPVGRVDDKSGNLITGLQATSAARPTYGRMPLGGVRNQITFSEDLTNAAWTKSRVTAASATNVVETVALDSHAVAISGIAAVSGVVYTATVTLEKGVLATAPTFMEILFSGGGFGSVQYAIVNVETGAVVSTAGGATCTSAADPLTPGGFRFSYTATALSTATAGFNVQFCNNNSTAVRAPSYAGLTTSDCSVYRTQVERSATATAYQKVVQAYDVTESGVASVDALWFDGVDDHLALTAAGADLARNTGRFTVFGGVTFTKSITANLSVILLVSSGASASNARVRIAGDNSALQLAARRLDADTALVMDSASVQVTFSNTIVAGVFDYTNADFFLRKDGAVVATDTTTLTDGSTSDTASLAVFIGRTGSSSFFGGFMSGVITVKGVTLSESQLLQTERYLGEQIGVTI